MSRSKNKLPPFVPVLKQMLKSNAWKMLSNPARVAYIHMKAKMCTPYPEPVTLSYREMEPFMRQETFSKATKQLEKYEFIKIVQKGGLYRRRNYYTFIEGWRDK